MIKTFAKGCIPKATSAEAEVSNLSLNCSYGVRGMEISSPLRKLSYGGLTVEPQLPGGWFMDLWVEELEGLDLIRSHGRRVFGSESWDSASRKNAVTHYYLHPHDRPCLLIFRRFHRIPEVFRETLRFEGPLGRHEISERLLRLPGRKVCVALDTSAEFEVGGGDVTFTVEGKGYGYALCFGEAVGKIERVPSMSLRLEPDVTCPGSYLKVDEETELVLDINVPQDLGEAEVALYGLMTSKRRLSLDREGCRSAFRFVPRYAGIIPLLVLIEGEDFVSFGLFEVLVLPTVVKSPDHRFNGVFVEYLRSMLQRRFFNVVPEEDPRGEMLYHHGFWPRNLYAYDLFCFGFQNLGVEMVKAFGYLLERYRFLFDAYSLDGREVFSNPLVSVSNDGIGFYLFQAGKMLLRRPDLFDEDFKGGIEKAVTWLDYCTHWNGLLADKTEAVDHCRSERLVGNPYSQSICMAGLKVISRALEEVGEGELAERAGKLFERQLEGFRRLYGEIGYFRDLVYVDAEKPRLSDYSMPAPGCFLLEPEVEEDSLVDMAKRTMEVIKERCTEEDNPWLVTGGMGRVGTSYPQLGTVAGLLNLGDLHDARKFLDEILRYAESTSLRYVLPEGVVLKSNREYEKVREEHRRRAPWLYAETPEGLPGWPCNPGNLVHMSYFLFVADLICGISHRRDSILVRPRVPSGWNFLHVENYPTRYGPISYDYRRKGGEISLNLRKPPVAAEVELGPFEKVRDVFVDDRRVPFEPFESDHGAYVRLSVEGYHVTIRVLTD